LSRDKKSLAPTTAGAVLAPLLGRDSEHVGYPRGGFGFRQYTKSDIPGKEIKKTEVTKSDNEFDILNV
jgi:hypothetical protein